VGVGVAADVDHLRAVGRLRQLLVQQLGGVRLEEQLAFEIEAGREPHVGVRRPGVAVDAATGYCYTPSHDPPPWRGACRPIKVTAGLRLTWDRKTFSPVPSQL